MHHKLPNRHVCAEPPLPFYGKCSFCGPFLDGGISEERRDCSNIYTSVCPLMSGSPRFLLQAPAAVTLLTLDFFIQAAGIIAYSCMTVIWKWLLFNFSFTFTTFFLIYVALRVIHKPCSNSLTAYSASCSPSIMFHQSFCFCFLSGSSALCPTEDSGMWFLLCQKEV